MERKTFFQTVYSTKSSKFGIKSYEINEFSSEHLRSFTIYTGKDNVQAAFILGDTNKTAAIVLSFVEPLVEKGRTLWMDNFYNSQVLDQRRKTLKTFHKE